RYRGHEGPRGGGRPVPAQQRLVAGQTEVLRLVLCARHKAPDEPDGMAGPELRNDEAAAEHVAPIGPEQAGALRRPEGEAPPAQIRRQFPTAGVPEPTLLRGGARDPSPFEVGEGRVVS